MKLQDIQEARYQTRGSDTGRQVVNRALEAVPDLRESGNQVFVSKFKDIDPNDTDIFLKTYKELVERFGEPRWERMSSEAMYKDPYWDVADDIYILLHATGLSVILR